MKIRIRGNAVRFRLTKSEVAKLAENGVYEEETAFADQTFKYSVKESDVPQLTATFSGPEIILYFPKGENQKWLHSDQVGYYADQVLPNGSTLSLKLEKDFVCMDETTEDQSDNYPNPKA